MAAKKRSTKLVGRSGAPMSSTTLTQAQMSELLEQLSRAKAILDTVYLASDSNIKEAEGMRDWRVEQASAAAAGFVKSAIGTLVEAEEGRQ